jgi:hypothetical protein
MLHFHFLDERYKKGLLQGQHTQLDGAYIERRSEERDTVLVNSTLFLRKDHP